MNKPTEIWMDGFAVGAGKTLSLLERSLGIETVAVALGLPRNGIGNCKLRKLMLRKMVSYAKPRTLETGPQKSARLRRIGRQLRDAENAKEMASLMASGESTEKARLAMKMGVVRGQRVRALATRMGLLSRPS